MSNQPPTVSDLYDSLLRAPNDHHNLIKKINDYIAKGGDILSTDFYDGTIMHHAAINDDPEIVRALLEIGISPEILDEDGNTPIMVATISPESFKILLEYGASIHKRNNRGETGLHIAAYEGDVDLVKYLLNAGLDVNAIDNDGNTAMHKACECDVGDERQLVESITELLWRGADLSIINNEGEDASDRIPEDDPFRIYHIFNR